MKLRPDLFEQSKALQEHLNARFVEFLAQHEKLGGGVVPYTWEEFLRNPRTNVSILLWYVFNPRKHRNRRHTAASPVTAISEEANRAIRLTHLNRREIERIALAVNFFQEEGIEISFFKEYDGMLEYRLARTKTS